MRKLVQAAALAVTWGLLPVAGQAESFRGPLQFFEGRTTTHSTVKLAMRKPFASRSIGIGQIAADGSLYLVQQVEDEGKKRFQRVWRMHQVAPGRFSGTMSEAVGPVVVEEVGNRYRFRLRMKGGVNVEQWLTPLADGISAKSETTIRKFGMVVGHSNGVIKRATRLATQP